MAEKKKNIFDQAIDALTNRDEKAAAEKAAAEKAAAVKAAAEKSDAERAAIAKATAEKVVAERAAIAKAAAEKAATAKAAADKAAADKAAAIKAQADKAAAIAKENAAKYAAGQATFAKISADKAAAAKAAAEKAAQPKKGIVYVRSLRIRKDHNTNAEVVAGLVAGNEVIILETWTDGKNTWAKLGPDQWAAIEYEGEILIKYSDQQQIVLPESVIQKRSAPLSDRFSFYRSHFTD